MEDDLRHSVCGFFIAFGSFAIFSYVVILPKSPQCDNTRKCSADLARFVRIVSTRSKKMTFSDHARTSNTVHRGKLGACATLATPCESAFESEIAKLLRGELCPPILRLVWTRTFTIAFVIGPPVSLSVNETIKCPVCAVRALTAMHPTIKNAAPMKAILFIVLVLLRFCRADLFDEFLIKLSSIE